MLTIELTSSKPAIRRIFYFITILLFTINSWASVFVDGYIKDNNGKPIDGAYITIYPTNITVQSDTKGYYQVGKIRDGNYQLIFNHISYNQEIIDFNASGTVTKNVNIVLNEKSYNLPKTVFTTLSNENKIVITRQEIEARNLTNTEKIFEHIPEVRYENIAGKGKIISLRGSESKHVAVMVDGMEINSVTDGSTNLSVVPASMIERVEVYKSGDLTMTSGSVGGAINIVTKKESDIETTLSYSNKAFISDRDNSDIDSFNNHQLGITLPITISNTTFITGIDVKHLPSEWSYINAAKEDEYRYINHPNTPRTMNNGYTKQISGFISTKQNILNTDLSTSIYYTNQKSGLPGSYDAPYYDAYSKTDELSFRLTGEKRIYDGYFMASTAVRYAKKNINISEGPEIGQTDYNDNVLHLKGDIRYTLNYGQYDFKTGISSEYEGVNADNLGNDHFNNYSQEPYISISRHFFKESYPVTLRTDFRGNYQDRENHFYPLYSASLNSEIKISNIVLIPNISYVRNIRMPDYNALFWSESAYAIGNSNLKPEKGETFEGTLNFLLNSDIQINTELTGFYKQLEDLIVWEKKNSGRYSPENIEGGVIGGVESSLNLKYSNYTIKTSYERLWTLTETDSKATDGKRMTYRPEQRLNVATSYEYNPFTFTFSGDYTGKMYLNSTNSIESAAYWLFNGQVNYNTTIYHFKTNFFIRSENIFDEQYQVAYGYPMPGRSIETGYSIKF